MAIPLASGISNEDNYYFDLAINQGLQGHYRDAVNNFQIAIEKYSRGRLPTAWRALLSNVLALFGDLQSAERQLGIAERSLSEASFRALPTFTVFIERAKANILTIRGQYVEGERLHRSALRAFDDITLRSEAGRALLKANTRAGLARNLVRQGRLVEGEVEIRRALRKILTSYGRNSGGAANMVGWFAEILAAQGRHAEAERLAQEQIDILRIVGAPSNSLKIAGARGRKADALAAQKQWASAVAE